MAKIIDKFIVHLLCDSTVLDDLLSNTLCHISVFSISLSVTFTLLIYN